MFLTSSKVKKMETNEILEVIMYQLGMILVIQLIRFAVDYCYKPFKNFVSSLFPD